MKAKKEKELTLKMPLKELKEVREIWYDVCAFDQALKGIDDGGTHPLPYADSTSPLKSD